MVEFLQDNIEQLTLPPTDRAYSLARQANSLLYTFGGAEVFLLLDDPKVILSSKKTKDTAVGDTNYLASPPVALGYDGRYEAFFSHVIEVCDHPMIVPGACSLQITDSEGDDQTQCIFKLPNTKRDAIVRMGNTDRTKRIQSSVVLGRIGKLLDFVSYSLWERQTFGSQTSNDAVIDAYPSSNIVDDILFHFLKPDEGRPDTDQSD